MRRALILSGLFSFGIATHTQGQAPAAPSREEYLKRSENQKTAGWILLGGGTAMMVAGGVLAASSLNHHLFEHDAGGDIGAALLLAGFASDLGSIPLFISSGKNARKAAMLSLGNQPVLLPANAGLIWETQPSLKLSWRLGR